MLVGIHVGRLGKIPHTVQVYEQILAYNKVDYIRLDVNDTDFWEKVRKVDLFIFRFNVATDLKKLANTIMPVIEKTLKIKCFPDLASSWIYDDKIREYYLLKHYNFPFIDSYIFWNKQKALEWTETAVFPVVFKLKSGSRSQNVMLVKHKDVARRLIKRMFGKGIDPDAPSFNTLNKIRELSLKSLMHSQALRLYRLIKGEDLSPYWDVHKNYVIFQKFLPNNPYDTRVTVIGDRAYALLRYNRKNDFRASGSGKYDLDRSRVDQRCLELAFRISDTLGFKSMAYDFLFNENNEPVISEISYTYPCIDQYEEPGYYDRNFVHHDGNYWAEYFHLIDLLGMPDLRQPEKIKLTR